MGRRDAIAKQQRPEPEICKADLLHRITSSYFDAWVKPLQLRQDIFGDCTEQKLNNARSSRISDALAELCAEGSLVVHETKPLYRLPGAQIPTRVCKGAWRAFGCSHCARELRMGTQSEPYLVFGEHSHPVPSARTSFPSPRLRAAFSSYVVTCTHDERALCPRRRAQFERFSQGLRWPG